MPDFGIFRGFNDKLFGDKLYAGQLPTQLGLIGSEDFSGFDVDAQAFFDRVTTAGGSLSAIEKTAIDTLVKQMKTDGIWTKMKAIYPMVGASAAACAQNLKSSSFTGTFNGGWTFASTGVTPNGTNGYFDTNFIMSSNLSNQSGHVSIYSRTSGNNGGDFGRFSNSGAMAAYVQFNGQVFNLFASGNFFTTSSTQSALGLFTFQRNSGNLETFQGVNKTNSSIAFTDFPNQSVVLGAILTNTNAIQIASSRNYAFNSIGDAFSDSEINLLNISVQAFNTTLNRQV